MFRIINGSADQPPATIEQMAALEFVAVKRLACMSKEQRTQKISNMATYAYQMVTIAMEFCIRDKADLVQLLREEYDTFGPALMSLAEAREDARALLDVISMGEARLAVALAVVEGDTEPPPDDGGEARGVSTSK
jgi:hypothetical protein